ncbi:MAG TPA: hypothetical protein VG476_12010, partial [Acidimicrobiales bacterium]|nr:hypothetical protein [Acidimicrobiales bacterium]
MLWRQWRTVERVGEDHLVPPRLVEGEAALVVLVDPALDTPVGTGEDHVRGAGQRFGLVQEGAEGRAMPLGRADRLQEPRLAERAGREHRPAVACALHRRDDRPCRPSP